MQVCSNAIRRNRRRRGTSIGRRSGRRLWSCLGRDSFPEDPNSEANLLTYKEFQQSGEGISTNILADRLGKLEAAGIITPEAEETDRRTVNYRLTEKGIDLAPVLLELLIWGARHEETGVPCALIVKMEKNREQVLAEARRRWRERDPTPLMPEFDK